MDSNKENLKNLIHNISPDQGTILPSNLLSQISSNSLKRNDQSFFPCENNQNNQPIFLSATKKAYYTEEEKKECVSLALKYNNNCKAAREIVDGLR